MILGFKKKKRTSPVGLTKIWKKLSLVLRAGNISLVGWIVPIWDISSAWKAMPGGRCTFWQERVCTWQEARHRPQESLRHLSPLYLYSLLAGSASPVSPAILELEGGVGEWRAGNAAPTCLSVGARPLVRTVFSVSERTWHFVAKTLKLCTLRDCVCRRVPPASCRS